MVNFPNPLPATLIYDRQKINVRIIADDLVANGERVMMIRYVPNQPEPSLKNHAKYMFNDDYNQKREERLK